MNLASPRGRLFLSRTCISKFDTSQNRKKFETPCNCAGVLLEFNTNNHNLSRILRDESGEKGNTPRGLPFLAIGLAFIETAESLTPCLQGAEKELCKEGRHEKTGALLKALFPQQYIEKGVKENAQKLRNKILVLPASCAGRRYLQ